MLRHELSANDVDSAILTGDTTENQNRHIRIRLTYLTDKGPPHRIFGCTDDDEVDLIISVDRAVASTLDRGDPGTWSLTDDVSDVLAAINRHDIQLLLGLLDLFFRRSHFPILPANHPIQFPRAFRPAGKVHHADRCWLVPAHV